MTIATPERPAADVAPFNRTIVLPSRMKPSKAAGTDPARPILNHAYLRRHEGDLWLCVTDSYIAAAIKVDGDAIEGWLPIGALKLMERGRPAVQVDEFSWTVHVPEGKLTFDCREHLGFSNLDRGRDRRPTYPDFAELGIFPGTEKRPGPLHETVASPVEVGLNGDFVYRLGQALGAGNSGMRFEIAGPLKPALVAPLNRPEIVRVGVQMPLRLEG